MCNLLADTLYFCGLEKNQYQIKLSNRKLIQGLIENLKISESKQQLTILRAIDKLDRIGADGVKHYLQKAVKINLEIKLLVPTFQTIKLKKY